MAPPVCLPVTTAYFTKGLSARGRHTGWRQRKNLREVGAQQAGEADAGGHNRRGRGQLRRDGQRKRDRDAAGDQRARQIWRGAQRAQREGKPQIDMRYLLQT